jgi:hypothetical protein
MRAGRLGGSVAAVGALLLVHAGASAAGGVRASASALESDLQHAGSLPPSIPPSPTVVLDSKGGRAEQRIERLRAPEAGVSLLVAEQLVVEVDGTADTGVVSPTTQIDGEANARGKSGTSTTESARPPDAATIEPDGTTTESDSGADRTTTDATSSVGSLTMSALGMSLRDVTASCEVDAGGPQASSSAAGTIGGHDVLEEAPPNTVILLPGVGQVTLNEQQIVGSRVEVTALDLEGRAPVTGHLRIAHVLCDSASASPPTIVSESGRAILLPVSALGVAAIGGGGVWVVRRRRGKTGDSD